MIDILFEDNQREIANKILNNQRISADEAIRLYSFNLSQLSLLATQRKQNISKNIVFYNRNIHIEPTNTCVYNCKFCSYKAKNEKEAYTLSVDEIIEKIALVSSNITEVHITGGVHQAWGICFFKNILKEIKQRFPKIHIKALTATEIAYMCNIDKIDIIKGLKILKANGLNSLPGGGAEIFDDNLRKLISPDKPSADLWLYVHKEAHKIGLHSNATMLYGHLETHTQRINHLLELRKLQDETNGFNAFIPLKFKNKNNSMSEVDETSIVEDLKTYSISRIFLDNIHHLKAYIPAVGRYFAQISLNFGVDDLDGTLNDSTSIYTRAGSQETPNISEKELNNLILKSGFIPAERDSLYREII